MDANNTRFHLLLGKADWTNCLADSGSALLDLDDACGSSAPGARIFTRAIRRATPTGTTLPMS